MPAQVEVPVSARRQRGHVAAGIALPRYIRVKDSGNMLPGIGGALDLIDSLCFTAPVFYLYLNLLLDGGRAAS